MTLWCGVYRYLVESVSNFYSKLILTTNTNQVWTNVENNSKQNYSVAQQILETPYIIPYDGAHLEGYYRTEDLRKWFYFTNKKLYY